MTVLSNKISFSRIILIGCSSGGMGALSLIASVLPGDYPFPIIVVQHRAQDEKKLLEEILQTKTKLRVKQADEKELMQNGTIYVAPPGYHLLIERDLSFSLTSDEPVNYSRPSIDVTFLSAAEACATLAVGIVLTGANNDGAKGIACIKKMGGLTIAEDPKEAAFPIMPEAAIGTGSIDHIINTKEIGKLLLNLAWKSRK